MDSKKYLSFNYDRFFGVEIEINSYDNRDFRLFPLDRVAKELPEGIAEASMMVQHITGESVIIKGWHLTHNNAKWVIKPDRSCGMEICSPVSKGWPGLKKIVEVVDGIQKDRRIPVDDRCSLHVHVGVGDCGRVDIGKILTYWIKSEGVFLDSFPGNRKRNSYCQCIGMSDLFEHNTPWDEGDIIRKLGKKKYYTANCLHYANGDRKSLEFRLAENAACVNPYFVKNWIRLVVHFVESAKLQYIPEPYLSSDPWTGFSWLDLKDVMKLLRFTSDYELSPGMKQTRDWFLARIHKNLIDPSLPGIWSPTARSITQEQLVDVIDECGLDRNNMEEYLLPSNPDLIYSNEYKI